MDEKQALVDATVKAIAYQENGGKPDLNHLSAGKSGEMKSIFQFTPDTWKKDAKIYLGDANIPISPDAETTVMIKKVGQLVDEGKNAKQIASMHNAGSGEPNAYTGKFSNGHPSIGTNSYGVKFNVPAYADGVAKKAQEFYLQEKQKGVQQPQAQQLPQMPTQQSQQTPIQQPSSAPTPSTPQGALGRLVFAKLGDPASPAGSLQQGSRL